MVTSLPPLPFSSPSPLQISPVGRQVAAKYLQMWQQIVQPGPESKYGTLLL